MSKNRKNILICPLDWGLGHAARCIPIIQKLAETHAVTIACSARLQSFYNIETPHIPTVLLEGKTITYPSNGQFFKHFLKQTPTLLFSVYKEHQTLKKIVKTYSIDQIISDNRYGLYHSKIPSVLITHQVSPQAFGRCSNRLAQKLSLFFLKKHTEVWVPDFEEHLLSGALSEGFNKIRFIGILSRFRLPAETVEIKPQVLVLISGCEPQRTIFENIILKQLKNTTLKAIIVRGLPEFSIPLENTANYSFFNHLPTEDLQKLILESQYIICRSGYSTLMDLWQLRRKALLIPTPGQPEQEFLAAHFSNKYHFPTQIQSQIDISDFLKSRAIYFNPPETSQPLPINNYL